jgi:hypothetical protein
MEKGGMGDGLYKAGYGQDLIGLNADGKNYQETLITSEGKAPRRFERAAASTLHFKLRGCAAIGRQMGLLAAFTRG